MGSPREKTAWAAWCSQEHRAIWVLPHQEVSEKITKVDEDSRQKSLNCYHSHPLSALRFSPSMPILMQLLSDSISCSSPHYVQGSPFGLILTVNRSWSGGINPKDRHPPLDDILICAPLVLLGDLSILPNIYRGSSLSYTGPLFY